MAPGGSCLGSPVSRSFGIRAAGAGKAILDIGIAAGVERLLGCFDCGVTNLYDAKVKRNQTAM